MRNCSNGNNRSAILDPTSCNFGRLVWLSNYIAANVAYSASLDIIGRAVWTLNIGIFAEYCKPQSLQRYASYRISSMSSGTVSRALKDFWCWSSCSDVTRIHTVVSVSSRCFSFRHFWILERVLLIDFFYKGDKCFVWCDSCVLTITYIDNILAGTKLVLFGTGSSVQLCDIWMPIPSLWSSFVAIPLV